jgi:hypothetical protein
VIIIGALCGLCNARDIHAGGWELLCAISAGGAGAGWYFCGDDVGGANFTFDAHNKNFDILSEDLNVFK